MPLAQPSATAPPRRVLIVDDSAVARAVIARAVERDGLFEVAGSVPSAPAALRFLKQNTVDFVLLDIEMPDVDGLTALPEIVATIGEGRVVVVSSADETRAGATVQALALGAVDRIAKPTQGGLASGFADRLLAGLTALSSEPVAASRMPMPRAPADDVAPALDPLGYDAIAIGASTGGIHALSQLLRAVPHDMRLPILVTQHLPASFMPYFAAQLAVLAGRPCDVAEDRVRVRPGRVLLAPGDAHIRCVRLPDGSAAVRLDRAPAESGCTPSVDPMFASAAEVWGPRVLAVVLSGMGRDGARGAHAVHAAGGVVLAQDRASSVVWGMPGAVAEIAAAQLDPSRIGALAGRCRTR